MDNLNNDELTEILVRLSVECLHRCKCVSKRWFALISDPSFVRHYIQLCSNSHHNDQFIVYRDYKVGQFSHIGLPIYKELKKYTTAHKKLNFSLNFLPILQDYSLSDFNILATSHGLLLCKAEFSVKPDYRAHYIVCNPLTKQWLKLPILQCKYTYSTAFEGFMCYSLNPYDHRVGFTVLDVECKDNPLAKSFNTHVFSSKTASWTNFVVACSPGPIWSELERELVSNNGMFYWYGNGWIVVYDPLNHPCECKLIELPSNASVVPLTPPLHLSEGHIRLVTIGIESLYHVWELTDHEKGAWCLKYQVESPFDYHWCLDLTVGDMVYFIDWYSGKLMFFNVKDDSQIVVMALDCTKHENHGRFVHFFMTLWPTPIPQLPHKG